MACSCQSNACGCPSSFQAVPITFPPTGNCCLCSGSITTTNAPVTITSTTFIGSTSGIASLAASICQTCTVGSNSLTYTFTGDVTTTIVFTATSFNVPCCAPNALTISGSGSLVLNTAEPVNVPFLLTISNCNPCFYRLIINFQGQVSTVPVITDGFTTVDCATLSIAPCTSPPCV